LKGPMESTETTLTPGSLLKRGHLDALLLGNAVAQVAFWFWYALPRFGTQPFGTDDFAAFWTTALLLRWGQGSAIYDLPAVAALQQSMGLPQTVPYLYPPFFLALMLPLTYLSPGWAYLLWGFFNVALIVFATWLLARTLVPREDRLTFVLLVCASLPAGRALYLGQTSPLLLLGLSVAVAGFLARGDRRTGLGSLALLIKPQLLPVWLLTLLWYRRFRSLAYFAAGSASLYLVSLLLVGPEGMIGYLQGLIWSGTADEVGFQAVGSHTLSGLAYGLAQGSASRAIYLLAAAATMGIFCWWLLRLRRQTSSSLRIASSLAIITALLVSSHTLLYDLMIWAIPLALFWARLSRGKGRYLIAAGFLAPWISSAFGMLGAGFVWPTVAVSIAAFGLLGYAALATGTEQAATPNDPASSGGKR
jgi:alpha-1,2-mannosyltransferase